MIEIRQRDDVWRVVLKKEAWIVPAEKIVEVLLEVGKASVEETSVGVKENILAFKVKIKEVEFERNTREEILRLVDELTLMKNIYGRLNNVDRYNQTTITFYRA